MPRQYSAVNVGCKITLWGKVAGMKAGGRSKLEQQVIAHNKNPEPYHLPQLFCIKKNDIGKHISYTDTPQNTWEADIGNRLTFQAVICHKAQEHQYQSPFYDPQYQLAPAFPFFKFASNRKRS